MTMLHNMKPESILTQRFMNRCRLQILKSCLKRFLPPAMLPLNR